MLDLTKLIHLIVHKIMVSGVCYAYKSAFTKEEISVILYTGGGSRYRKHFISMPKEFISSSCLTFREPSDQFRKTCMCAYLCVYRGEGG